MAVIAAADPPSCSKSRLMPPQERDGSQFADAVDVVSGRDASGLARRAVRHAGASRGRHRPGWNGAVPDAAVQLMTRSGLTAGLLGPLLLAVLPLSAGCQRGHREPPATMPIAGGRRPGDRHAAVTAAGLAAACRRREVGALADAEVRLAGPAESSQLRHADAGRGRRSGHGSHLATKPSRKVLHIPGRRATVRQPAPSRATAIEKLPPRIELVSLLDTTRIQPSIEWPRSPARRSTGSGPPRWPPTIAPAPPGTSISILDTRRRTI